MEEEVLLLKAMKFLERCCGGCLPWRGIRVYVVGRREGRMCEK